MLPFDLNFESLCFEFFIRAVANNATMDELEIRYFEFVFMGSVFWKRVEQFVLSLIREVINDRGQVVVDVIFDTLFAVRFRIGEGQPPKGVNVDLV